MKKTIQITGIVAIFLALLIPQSSYGQVTISMSADGDLVEINSTAELAFVAYYTKEGYRKKIDYLKYSEQPTSDFVSIGDLKGQHDHISIFAINKNGDVAAKIFSLTDGIMPVKSTLVITEGKDDIHVKAPSLLMYTAVYTKEGFWGIREIFIENKRSGNRTQFADSRDESNSKFISIAGIDADGNVYARKISLQ
ncbi:MAG: hypothetical protein ACI8P3_000011 [Saprospiraceae bacterium]|jgi:hypothetical protein